MCLDIRSGYRDNKRVVGRIPVAGVRIGQAAELLGVSVETLRRWEAAGKLRTQRSAGGQRVVPAAEVSRLRKTQRGEVVARARQSARNRFDGVVTRIEKDRVAAVVEVLAGPHRLVSLLTAEAVTDMRLRVGDRVVCVVKATNVIVELAERSGGER